jgi:hypothetical protein
VLDALWAEEHLPPTVAAEFQPGNLEAKFVAPPFSVLDTRQGYWQERRRAWLSLGIKSELGRGEDLLSLSPAEGARARWAEGMQSGEGRALVAGKGNARSDYGAYDTNVAEGAQGGTSIFDPVLCELMYRWFAPEGGLVLDPFAGGSVRGIVAAKLGHPYTGIDLSLAQLEANRRQAEAMLAPSEPHPSWLHGDSRHLEDLLPAGQLYDMVMTCPPYFDLEVYSDDPADLSNAAEYSAFLEGYGDVIHFAARRLLPERFMVLVVSEIRDPDGYCRGFVPDTVQAAREAGLHLYNEAVLVNAAGSLPLRVTKYMEASRKLGRAHQNVLCFLKGKPPRGWSYDRAAPPSPQLDLALEPEPMPSQPALAAPAAEAPVVAPLGAEPETTDYRASTEGTAGVTLEDDLLEEAAEAERYVAAAEEAAVEALLEDAEWVADVEGLPQDAGLQQQEDGRWADPETGELFSDDGAGGPGEPVRPLEPPPPPEPAQPPARLIQPGNEWRCAGCGQPPTGPLDSTVIPGMARGECDNCGSEKVYRRMQ